jgi:hypothetical protein
MKDPPQGSVVRIEGVLAEQKRLIHKIVKGNLELE